LNILIKIIQYLLIGDIVIISFSKLPSANELASKIDHTFLKPFGLPDDIFQICEEAKHYGFAMVAVNPAETKKCSSILSGSPVHVGAAIGFPLGQNTIKTKVFETLEAIENGADEIDMVINIRALQEGNVEYVRKEITDVIQICRRKRIISKVILETCYLSDNEKKTICHIAAEEGADFVKTSTGFGESGATLHDINLMQETLSGACKIKAAGGIRDLSTTLRMLNAGASRIGTSKGVSIIKELVVSAP
jgi:deoxyribose-phosphate aldolase